MADQRYVEVNSKEHGRRWVPLEIVIRDLAQKRKPIPAGCHGECGARHFEKTRHPGCAYGKVIGKVTTAKDNDPQEDASCRG